MKLIILLLALAATVISGNSICPGAPPFAYVNGVEDCDKPVCTTSETLLRPSRDPTKFFVCAGPAVTYEMSCAPGTCFSYKTQGCVFPRDWVDACQWPATVSLVETTTVKEETTNLNEETTAVEAGITIVEEVTNNPKVESTTALIVNVCPGSDPAAVTFGPLTCQPIECQLTTTGMFPSRDPHYYYTCHTGQVLMRERCSTGCFDAARQECVDPSIWQNSCEGFLP